MGEVQAAGALVGGGYERRRSGGGMKADDGGRTGMGGEEVWEDAKAGNGEYPARGRRRTSALAEDGRNDGGRARWQRMGASVEDERIGRGRARARRWKREEVSSGQGWRGHSSLSVGGVDICAVYREGAGKCRAREGVGCAARRGGMCRAPGRRTR